MVDHVLGAARTDWLAAFQKAEARAREKTAEAVRKTYAFVSFALDPEGKVEQAKMRAVSPATDFSFDFQDLLLRPVRPSTAP